MGTWNPTETQRLARQEKLDASKSLEQRNRMGQFATPPELARQIVAQAATFLPENEPIRFLDPAVGTGSFFSALLDSLGKDRITKALGFDIDPHYGKPAQDLWGDSGLRVRLADFTTQKAPQQNSQRFNLVICNPPYVRHHHLEKEDKLRLVSLTREIAGIKLSGLAGLYCHFMALSKAWMSEGGIAAWLVPSEFMDVNYGEALKGMLLDSFELLHVHRFSPEDGQFSDALVSSTVLFLRLENPPVDHRVKFTLGGKLDRPTHSALISRDTLSSERKWTRFPLMGVRTTQNGPTLGDFFKIKRGLATGANAFFIMTPEQARERGLPDAFLRPILPSPRYLDHDEISSNKDGLPILERRLLLLDCPLAETKVAAEYPSLWRYLQSGVPEISGRYLCSRRKPWYSQEHRPAAPIVCTYLGRKVSGRQTPFRFILNLSHSTATNVYLMLYPKPRLAQALKEEPSLTREVWATCQRLTERALLDESRVYGGGMHKLEPKELARVVATELDELLGVQHPPHQMVLFA